MPVLRDLVAALSSGAIEVVDLTAPLSERDADPPAAASRSARPPAFELEEISRYDDRGPAWYWNNFRTGEHTGTHFDAPIHWVTGQDKDDVVAGPGAAAGRAGGRARLLRRRPPRTPTSCSRSTHIEAWEAEHGPLPDGGWLLFRTGWDARSHDAGRRSSTPTRPARTRPACRVECARWLAEEAPIIGVGVETVGTDAGAAHSFDPPFPCHSFLLGAGKYGLTQLQNLARLPPTGAVVIAGPLPIVGGSGSPARVLALVERCAVNVAEAVGRRSPRAGVDHVFGVVGSGNFHVTNALVAAGARFVAARHEGGAATMADAYARVSGPVGRR